MHCGTGGEQRAWLNLMCVTNTAAQGASPSFTAKTNRAVKKEKALNKKHAIWSREGFFPTLSEASAFPRMLPVGNMEWCQGYIPGQLCSHQKEKLFQLLLLCSTMDTGRHFKKKQNKLPPPPLWKPLRVLSHGCTQTQKEYMKVFKDTLHSERHAVWVSGVADHHSQVLFLGHLYAGLKAATPAQLLQIYSKGDKQEIGVGFYSLCFLKWVMLWTVSNERVSVSDLHTGYTLTLV